MNDRLHPAKASRSAAVKARLDHPVIDTDVHVNDYAPVLEDYIQHYGGSKLVDALRKALEAADFASVRGEFRYQPNHFPAAGFFRADVAAAADGKVGFVNKGPIFADLSKVSDQYAAQCAMK